MSHKKEHTVMVNKVLQELARQQGQTVEAVLEQLFCRASIVNTGLLNESFREASAALSRQAIQPRYLVPFLPVFRPYAALRPNGTG